jgi:hypothetical protein
MCVAQLNRYHISDVTVKFQWLVKNKQKLGICDIKNKNKKTLPRLPQLKQTKRHCRQVPCIMTVQPEPTGPVNTKAYMHMRVRSWYQHTFPPAFPILLGIFDRFEVHSPSITTYTPSLSYNLERLTVMVKALKRALVNDRTDAPSSS